MPNTLLFVLIAVVVTYILVYYSSGIYFYFKKHMMLRRNIRYFEEKIKNMEDVLNNAEAFRKLDSSEQEKLAESLQRHREALADLRENGLN